MKTILIILISASTMAFAGQENFGNGSPTTYNPELIYKALKVKEVILNPGQLGSTQYGKSVGGLSCSRSIVVVPNAVPTYFCTIQD